MTGITVDKNRRVQSTSTYPAQTRAKEIAVSFMRTPATSPIDTFERQEKIVNFKPTKNGQKLLGIISEDIAEKESSVKKEYLKAHPDATPKELAEIANKSTKACYHYVKKAIKEAGLAKDGELEGVPAYTAANQLAKLKKTFYEAKNLKLEDLKYVPDGTVIVWDRKKGHPNGHIEIAKGGTYGCSDFRRILANDYGSKFRVFLPLDA